MLSRNTVGAVELLYSRKLDNRNRGTNALTPPLVLGNLISYRGFKEMLFLGGSSDIVYSIDAVLNRVLWTRDCRFDRQPQSPGIPRACPGGLMGIVMTGSAAGGFGAPPPSGVPARSRRECCPQRDGEERPGLWAGEWLRTQRARCWRLAATAAYIRCISRTARCSASRFRSCRPHSNVRSVNLFDYTLYAATFDGCGGPNAVYALDLASDGKAVAKFETGGAHSRIGRSGDRQRRHRLRARGRQSHRADAEESEGKGSLCDPRLPSRQA